MDHHRADKLDAKFRDYDAATRAVSEWFRSRGLSVSVLGPDEDPSGWRTVTYEVR